MSYQTWVIDVVLGIAVVALTLANPGPLHSRPVVARSRQDGVVPDLRVLPAALLAPFVVPESTISPLAS